MKILSLRIAGFGPYKDEQLVDFQRFDADGIFLITGKTGAGKSSILDAITFALYGSVARYEGTQPQLRSDYCEPDDPTYVELEFAVGADEYRVRRSPDYDRPKKNGLGVTRKAHEAALERRNGDTWQGIGARPVDVGRELAEILTLTKDQFLQVILLAQNRFQTFLQSKNDDRQAVLRTLFGTRRFEQVEATLDERRKIMAAELAASTDALAQRAHDVAALMGTDEVPSHPDTDWFQAQFASLTARGDAADAQASAAGAAFDEADAAFRAILEAQKQHQRRVVALRELAMLEENHRQIEGDRRALAAAHRAAPVWPLVGALETAARHRDSAAAAEVAARLAYSEYDAKSDVIDADQVTTVADALTSLLGTLAETLDDEKRLPGIVADLERSEADVLRATTSLETARELSQLIPEALRALTEQITTATIASSRLSEAEERTTRVAAALAAADDAAALDTRLAAARVSEKAASGAHLAAAGRLDSLLERRLSGHAAELAVALVDGVACAVCGSLSHPAPAVADVEPVTEADIAAARVDVDRQWRSAREAAEAATEIATTLADARARTGGRSATELHDALDSAREATSGAIAAAAEVRRLERDRDKLLSERDRATITMDDLRAQLETLAVRVAEQRSTRNAIEARQKKHSDGFGSVAERVSALSAHRNAAREVREAIATHDARRDAHAHALSALELQCVTQGFADVNEAMVARLSDADVTAIDNRIRAHEHAMTTVRTTIDDTADVTDPVDDSQVESAREAREARARERDAAVGARSTVRERLDQLTQLVITATNHIALSGARRDEFAQLDALANAVQGKDPNTKRMNLETFVLAAQLEDIVAAANARLHTMTSGRYALEHDDGLQYRKSSSGLGLAIRDEHTGRARPTHSLSGGETFLASLALALGLAEVVTNQTGGLTLDTLFVDEGFGSLDADTLDIAMGTLDSLRAGGRTIGLISHVDVMKEQIPAHLRISVTPHGYSVIDEVYETS
ncbi:AAA family ATPase [Glaciihabitans sp. dw_435]|uniref:AAA family ATPase n=1 Tax=Glaciihabitans sp. dw_435 TaxID=2720081 RepID=UPI001BD67596|nr:SMC family ATPase [Glaciihabitans sp. dw_435]